MTVFLLALEIPTVERRPRDCSEVRALGRTVTGIYKVYPDTQKKRIEMSVYCDFSSQKESWLVCILKLIYA